MVTSARSPGEKQPTKNSFPFTPPDSEDSVSTKSSLASSDSESLPCLPPVPQRPGVDILEVDKNTPDRHVPRDHRLIRLTGVHPFNVEAPLSDLFDEGFLTTPELFYVRNHGPVPEVHDAEVPNWEFSVEG